MQIEPNCDLPKPAYVFERFQNSQVSEGTRNLLLHFAEWKGRQKTNVERHIRKHHNCRRSIHTLRIPES